MQVSAYCFLALQTVACNTAKALGHAVSADG